jgi:protein tyrosine phosphatase (PTP) superfamily phosphohydrolase (DUF442 family)
LTKILDKEIQIKYNNDKTSVEQETLDKLNTIIKSKTAVEQETFDKLNTIIKSKIGFKSIIENRDEEEDKERKEEEDKEREEEEDEERAIKENKFFVPIPPTTSKSTRYQRNYTKKIKELNPVLPRRQLNPVLPRRYLSNQPLTKKKCYLKLQKEENTHANIIQSAKKNQNEDLYERLVKSHPPDNS